MKEFFRDAIRRYQTNKVENVLNSQGELPKSITIWEDHKKVVANSNVPGNHWRLEFGVKYTPALISVLENKGYAQNHNVLALTETPAVVYEKHT